MQVENGKYVSFHFMMYTASGEYIGGSDGQPPLSYIHGETVIEPAGLMEYLEGKEEGHAGEAVLPPEKAYGEQLLPPGESADIRTLDNFWRVGGAGASGGRAARAPQAR